MSVPVPLSDLRRVAGAYGATPYLITVGPDAAARATSVTVDWEGDVLVAGAGRRVAANVSRNDQVVLLWPAPRPGDYALIVDGWADLRPAPPGIEVVVRPGSAILHVTQADEAARAAEGAGHAAHALEGHGTGARGDA